MRRRHEGIEEVRRLREEGKSLNEICYSTGVSKATAYGWIKDMPIPEVVRSKLISGDQKAGNSRFWNKDTILRRAAAMKETYAKRRREKYEMGREEAPEILKDASMRDFVCLYIAEGFKKTIHSVSVINTDPMLVGFCGKIMSKYASRPIRYRLLCSLDERDSLMQYWSEFLKIPKDEIQFQSKKQVSKRRSEFGLMVVRVGDTVFRSRLQAWMDELREQWAISLMDRAEPYGGSGGGSSPSSPAN